MNGGGQVIFFESKENLGFAGGNNFLYKKIQESGFKADFFVFINNDAYLVSNDFQSQIEDEFTKSGFAVAGPRIILGNNCIDGFPFDVPSEKSVKKEILYWKTAEVFSAFPLIFIFIFFARTLHFTKRVFLRQRFFIDKSRRREKVLLQGACLVFSKKYFDFYSEPFDPRTFLYKEEEILLLRLLKKDLLSVFLPDVIVFHEGGASTVKNRSKNQIFNFRAKHFVKSLKILLSEIQKMKKN